MVSAYSASPGRIFARRFTIILLLIGIFNLAILYFPKDSTEEGQPENDKQEQRELPLELQDEFKTNTNLNSEITFPYANDKNDGGKKTRMRKVLVWNHYWESMAVWQKIFYEIIYHKCPQSNCVLTNNKAELNSSDAVLVHLIDLPIENYHFPDMATRNLDQIWIAMTYEPPYILRFTGLNFTLLNGIFNRTMSYRRDSDIVVRHGTYVKIEDNMYFPNFISNWIGSHESTETRDYSRGKRRLVAWFASSRGCNSQSGREIYVRELENHIPVDIYGACGPYKCGTQKTMRHPYKVEEDDCYMLVSVGYKFVLSFENSICEDYVTEKLYNNLKLNVVPIVFGGGNYSYYSPPHSVIDATKFTPQELGKYLLMLDQNDTLYNEYFAWKKSYYIEAHDGIPLACDLCTKLHNDTWMNQRKTYGQLDQWLLSRCSNGYMEGQAMPMFPKME